MKRTVCPTRRTGFGRHMDNAYATIGQPRIAVNDGIILPLIGWWLVVFLACCELRSARYRCRSKRR